MPYTEFKVRDVRQGDWYWISKVLLDEYGQSLKPIGIAIYNCLAKLANQDGLSYPSHNYIAKKIGASRSSVKRGIKLLIELRLIRQERKRYHNVYYLLKLDRSDRANLSGEVDNGTEIGQPDPQIAHTDPTDSPAGTTNNN